MLVECPAFGLYEQKLPVLHARRSSSDATSGSSCGWHRIAGARTGLPHSFDGSAEDDKIVANRGRRASAGVVGLQAPIQSMMGPFRVPSRPRGRTVADRVRAFDTPPRAKGSNDEQLDNLNLRPSGFKRRSSFLTRRMTPFVRRDAEAASTGSRKPSPQSTTPLRTPVIHAPMARRNDVAPWRDGKIPSPHSRACSSGETPEQAPPVQKSSSEERPDSTAMKSVDFEAIPLRTSTTELAFPFSCARHGRKLKYKARTFATIDGLEKTLSGAYIPSGKKNLLQPHPASQYHFSSKLLTKMKGRTPSPEVCPDCVAEEVIRRREDSQSAASGAIGSSREQDASPREISSVVTEPPTPEQEPAGMTLIGTTADHQAVFLPGSSLPTIESAGSSLIAADLGDMIDAIIIEHRGTLNRVITNLRDGTPNINAVRRMSRELSMVSSELNDMHSPKMDILDQKKGMYSVILDTPPEFLSTRTKSVPDIIDYIDSAAKDLGLRLAHDGADDLNVKEKSRRNRPADIPSRGDSNNLGTRSLEEVATMLRHRAANKSVVPHDMSSLDSRQESTSERQNSPLLVAVNVCETMPRSMPVPMIGSAGIMHRDFVSPYANQRGSTDRHPEATAFHQPDKIDIPARVTAKASGFQSAPLISPQVDRTWEGGAASTKIPEPRSKSRTSPRRHGLLTIVKPAVPWTRPVTGARRDPLQALKPSEIRELRKQRPGTFAQPFVKELARDTSFKERSDRRSRLSRTHGGSSTPSAF